MKTINNLNRGDLVSDFTQQVKFLYYETNVDYMETGYMICTDAMGQRVRMHISEVVHTERGKKAPMSLQAS
jgi:hypothetical protein